MEDLYFGRIAALVPEFAVKDLPLGRTHYDDDLPGRVKTFGPFLLLNQNNTCTNNIIK